MSWMIDDYNNRETIVKVIPLAGGGNILCGYTGFCAEMRWRRERNQSLSEECKFPILTWDELEIYFDGGVDID